MTSLNEFLANYRNQNTITLYRSGVTLFIESVYGRQREGNRATKDETDRINELSIQYLQEDRDHGTDLLAFARSLGERPPKSARAYMSTVREFLAENEIDISARKLKRVRQKLPQGGVWTQEEEITVERIQKVLFQMPAHGKALFLLQASSGARIGELLKLKITDVNLTSDPPEAQIRAPNTKKRVQRYIFFSDEAKQAIEHWLTQRDRFMKGAQYKNRGFVQRGLSKERSMEDDRLFPFSRNTVAQVWENALKKTDLYRVDEYTGRKTTHPHMLRKFFLSAFDIHGIKAIGERLAGHEGYLTVEYRNIPKEKMVEGYKTVMPFLSIFTPAEVYTRTADLIAAQRRQEAIIAQMRVENEAIKMRMEEMQQIDKIGAEVEARALRSLTPDKLQTLLALIDKYEREAST